MKNSLVRMAVLISGLALLPALSEAQERTIRGAVVDSSTAAPVQNATVQLADGDVGTLTGEDGSFVLRGVPSRGVTIEVRRIGYRTRTVEVPAGTNRVTIQLPAGHVAVGELVVTGRATQVERRNLATSVTSVQGEEVDRTSQQSVDKALQGRVSGAVISRNSGAPGGGVQVQLRGPSSINARSAPLYVVDGVLVSNESIQPNANAVTAAATGSNPSLDQDNPQNRIADLNPRDIESIEVLKGPAAAAIYGQKASNGVIIIETKKGTAGSPQWRVRAMGGFSDLSEKIGSRRFETVDEVASTFGADSELVDEWQENSEQFFDGGTPFFDHEEALSSRNDLSWEASANVRGGSPEGISYYTSLLGKEDEGIVENTGFERQSMRLNLTGNFSDRFTANFSSNLVRTNARRGLTNNDNSQTSYFMVLSATPSFVDLEQRPDGTFPVNPAVGNGSNPLQTAALMDKREEVFRLTGATSLDFDLVQGDQHNVTLRATGGVDWFGQTNDIFSPPELHFEPADGFDGTKILSKSDNLQWNTDVNAIWDFSPSEGTTWTTSAGFQFEFSELNIDRTVGQNLTGGKDKVDAATVIGVRQNREQVEDFGFYLQEQLLTFDERLTVTGAVRLDQSSTNADTEKLFVFPHASASYRIPDLGGVVSEVKFRGAFGQTGNRPLFGQKFTSLELIENIDGIPGFTVEGSVADPNLEPERQTEVEGGIDVTLFDGRARLETTGYWQSITNLILERELAPSSGFDTKFFNGGELRSYGIEVALDGTPVSTEDFTWDARASFDLNRTEVTDLPVSSFVTGSFGASLGAFRVQEGEPLSQIVGTDPRPSVADDRGLVRNGDANPDFNLGLSSTVSWQGFSLSQLWDIRPGFQVINLTELLYDAGNVSPDFEDQDGEINTPTPVDDPDLQSTLGSQLGFTQFTGCFPNCSGLERILGFAGGWARPYTQDAGFVKLREVTLGWEVPSDVVESIWGGFESVRLTVSGRNLLTFTDYRGLDPEVSNFGQENFARNVDVAPYPPSRSFWFGIETAF